MIARELGYGICWWCGSADELVRLEGARLAGSPPMPLPTSIVTEDDRERFRVCVPCATRFGYARLAHDVELFEAGVLAPTIDQATMDQATTIVRRRVWARIERAIRETRRHAEGE